MGKITILGKPHNSDDGMEKLTTRDFSRYLRNRSVLLFLISIAFLLYALVDADPNAVYMSVPGIILLIISLAFFGKSLIWASGAHGEEAVLKELRKIPDSKIYNDVVLPDCSWNIDHIVISKKGVFLIETKNYHGEVVEKNGEWFNIVRKNGQSYENHIKNPSAQARRQAAQLNRFLKEKGIQNIWVYPVLVFADDTVKINIQKQEIPVLIKSQIREFMGKQTDSLADGRIKKLGEVITGVPAKQKRPAIKDLWGSGWFSLQLNNVVFGLVYGSAFFLLDAFLSEEIDLEYVPWFVLYKGFFVFAMGGLIVDFFNLRFKLSESRWIAMFIIGEFFMSLTMEFFGLDSSSLHDWIFSILNGIFIILTIIYFQRLFDGAKRNIGPTSG